ncbi:ABC transporter substrate-binding protein [Thiohalomonas denitrificans]|uniref:Iron complex transport system substrate-binding protein n=1 Tax=Thiohalomonas denitrificans TaxID=415747 RepID=A0A1G5PMN6_9GAMM|nr:ABC transporter substrate-binding protein [Thiohalomonas denitrificans]SCZ50733.1 iron complex transport system substrate-binding protein [Thiohalomonas denitrificans]
MFDRCLFASLLAAVLWSGSATTPAVAEPTCPRIISQSPYITHSLKWLNLDHCIVGVSRYDPLDRPPTGGVLDPDSAAIAELTPDLMLTSDWISAGKWQAAAPAGARALRLEGFGSMTEIETNLYRISEAAGVENGGSRSRRFARDWRKAAARVRGRGRALVVSACRGVPYSFGKATYLYDLFTAAGFDVVETHEKIRHIKSGEPHESLAELLAAFSPDWLFVLTRRNGEQCAALKPRSGINVVGLDGESFFHPAPTLLKGLEQLAEQRERWHYTGQAQ